MQNMDVDLLKDAISDLIKNIPVGLHWKMISHGLQGTIPKEQVKALHVLVDKLDVHMAKPLLTALYTSQPMEDHKFPLHVRMQLVPEMDAVLNTKGRQQVDKLRACQNTWLSGKLVQIKTWEIELLDDMSKELGEMTLCDAMMGLCHPTNKKFNLFHTIDKHFQDKCHVLMVLKSVESQAHAMIAAMLPYLLWQHTQSKPGPQASAFKKWFKLAAHRHVEGAFWCPKDECVKNQSNLMLAAALTEDNALYWEMDGTKPPSPKRKCPQAEEESLDNSVSTVKTAMSTKKIPKLVLKGTPAATS